MSEQDPNDGLGCKHPWNCYNRVHGLVGAPVCKKCTFGGRGPLPSDPVKWSNLWWKEFPHAPPKSRWSS